MLGTSGGWTIRTATRRLGAAAPSLLAAVLIAGIAAASVLTLWNGYLRAHAEAGRELRNLAFMLADHTTRTFQAVDVKQDALIERLLHDGVDSEDGLRDWARRRAAHEVLRDRAGGLPYLDVLAIADAAGNLVASSRAWPPPTLNIAETDLYALLRLGTERHVSQPRLSQWAGRWSIYRARRIADAEGRFLGMVLAGIEVEHFEQLFGRLALQAESNILLISTDGVAIARHPPAPNFAGRDYRGRPGFERVLALRPNEVGQIRSSFDGHARLIYGQPIEGLPLRIHVGVSRDAALAPWRQEAIRLAVGTVLLILAIGGGTALLVRQARSRAAVAEQRLAHQQEMAAQHAVFRRAVEGMSQGVWMFGPDGRLVLTNTRYVGILDLPPGAVEAGVRLEDLMAAAAGRDALAAVQRLGRLVETRRAGAFVQDLGGGRAASVTCAPLADGGWIATFEDVSERRRAEARMAYMARHDDLTGLPNRAALQDRLATALREMRGGQSFSVLYLDLDRFKVVNDTLGHGAGDALLHEAAVRLQQGIRSRRGDDMLARFGGDEFCIVTTPGPAAQVAADAASLAERLIALLSEPFELEGQQLLVGASVGIALCPAHGASAEDLLKRADLALYRAKREGRGRQRIFEPAMEAEAQMRRQLELDLRRALTAPGCPELELHYQPFVRVATGQVVGLEALLRWRHPVRGLVSPVDFIPLAEETGLIDALGEFVMGRACATAAQWPAELRVAVNLSPVQFRGAGLVEVVARALAASGLDPRRLELEITEGVLMEGSERNIALLHRLRALGVRIAMDDFGTGYSSLGYLRSFPFDKVKVDRSFINELATRDGDLAILQAMVQLCGRLDVTSNAEGVETAEQLVLLRREGCAEAQGFFISRPVPGEDVPDLLERLAVPRTLVAIAS
ncbi:MAG: EAL domain-containing protein [Acetobacteraceae bacterium]|nr:EAL domain-containing protein [Acetobacteraceae bacterium]